MRSKPQDEVAENEQEMAAAVINAAKKTLISQVVKRNVIENIVPIVISLKHMVSQHGKFCTRVATAQGKQGIWLLLFPDRENTGNFALTQGKILRHRENIFL